MWHYAIDKGGVSTMVIADNYFLFRISSKLKKTLLNVISRVLFSECEGLVPQCSGNASTTSTG